MFIGDDRNLFHNLIRRLNKTRRRLCRRLTTIRAKQIDSALDLLGTDCSVLFVHSSLSACGHIVDGPKTLIECLKRRCSTLALPTHTYCYPINQSEIGEIFDPKLTKSQVGEISDYFWKQNNAIRSYHPTHSIAAYGEHATAICMNHEACETPCGAGSPYEKLLNYKSAVLMFGCDMNTYTLFHTSEAKNGCDYLYTPGTWTLRYRDNSGNTVLLKSKRQDMSVNRRFREMEDVLLKNGLLRRTRLGKGWLLFIPDSSRVDEYISNQIAANRRYLVEVDR